LNAFDLVRCRVAAATIGLPKDTGLELEVEDGGLAW
jgi:hypothetical protein